MSSGRQKRHSILASVLGVGLVCAGSGTALAGEKANITAPTVRKTPANLEPPKKTLPFRPLDGSSSVGGVVDGGGVPELPAVEPSAPSPRAQKEMLERLDRKRNFLLNDSSGDAGFDNRSTEGTMDLKTQDELQLSPRKPRTALERRLQKGNNTTGEEKSGSKVEAKETADEEQEDSDNEAERSNLTGLGTKARSRVDQGTSPGFLAPHPTEKGVDLNAPLDTAAPSGRLEDLRSPLSSATARGTSIDSLSRERMERFQQLSGDGESLRRGFGNDPAEFGQSRQLRSDTATSVYSTGPAEKSSKLAGSPIESAPSDAFAVRSNPLLATPAGGGIAGFAPPTPSGPPQLSPAATMLRQPRPEPPRFRQ